MMKHDTPRRRIPQERPHNALGEPARHERETPHEAGTVPIAGYDPPNYEEWTLDELDEKAQQIGIESRPDMDKDELIKALRER